MSLQATTYLVVGLTFALYIGIAIWSRASTTKDFYVAGSHVHPVANGMATAADWMSAASFISMAGIIAFAGYDGSRFLMGWTGGYVLLALLLLALRRRRLVPLLLGHLEKEGGVLGRLVDLGPGIDDRLRESALELLRVGHPRVEGGRVGAHQDHQ